MDSLVAGLQCGLQGSEIGPALGIEHHRLAIHDEVLVGDLGKVVGESLKAIRPVERAAGEEAHVASRV